MLAFILKVEDAALRHPRVAFVAFVAVIFTIQRTI